MNPTVVAAQYLAIADVCQHEAAGQCNYRLHVQPKVPRARRNARRLAGPAAALRQRRLLAGQRPSRLDASDLTVDGRSSTQFRHSVR